NGFDNYINNRKKSFSKKEKATVFVYLILRILTVCCAIAMTFLGNYGSVALSILTLVLFTFPDIIQKQFGVRFPTVLEIIVYCFIFAAEILGEIVNFYGKFPFWDTALHTVNGFLCAAIGFCLVDLLNQKSKLVNLSPLYVAITAFCFSMTVGVCWEFVEFTSDSILYVDMQKDTLVHEVKSVLINPEHKNDPIILKDIEGVTVHMDDGEDYEIEGGYLDIGLIDTMKDLFVNLIGALVFCTFGYIYIKYREKNSFAANFIPIVDKEEK
ncbi:MAG: hypothetical protein K6F69_04700, partial [Treponema sp.]|nr:hypothetical protein [Treponema sp.]